MEKSIIKNESLLIKLIAPKKTTKKAKIIRIVFYFIVLAILITIGENNYYKTNEVNLYVFFLFITTIIAASINLNHFLKNQ